MCFVNYKTCYISGKEHLLDGSGSQGFRRNIQKRSCSIHNKINGLLSFDWIQESIYGDCIYNSYFSQVINLVFHQGLQRGYYNSKTMRSLSCYQCRKLECDRLASACRKNSKKRFAANSCFCCLLLKGFTVICPEFIKSKNLFKPLLNI